MNMKKIELINSKEINGVLVKNYEVSRGDGRIGLISLRYLFDHKILSIYLSDFLIYSKIRWGTYFKDSEKLDKIFRNPYEVPQIVPNHFSYSNEIRVIKLITPYMIPTVEVIEGCVEIF